MIVKISKDDCSVCGTCTDICPTGAIELLDGEYVVNKEICVGCSACVSECPSEAITVVE